MPTTLLAAAAKSAAAPSASLHRAIDAIPRVRTNVSETERWLSLGLGAGLSVFGFDCRGPSLLSVLTGGFLLYRAATGNCPAYQALGIDKATSGAPNTAVPARQGTRVEHAVAVNKSALEVYRFWRHFENLPRFMTHVEDVDTSSDGRSHWVVHGPLGLRVEWDAELVTDEPGRTIAWKSIPGSDVDTAGSVHFRELGPGRGTEVRVNLKYDPPAGQVGTAVARLFGESPDRQIRDDLRRFKQLLEAGEVPTTRGQPHGRR